VVGLDLPPSARRLPVGPPEALAKGTSKEALDEAGADRTDDGMRPTMMLSASDALLELRQAC
jgi:hypothetical protein